MKHKIIDAFDCIRAEDELKAEVLTYIYKKRSHHERLKIKKFAYAALCFICIFAASLFSYSIYSAEYAYIDLDINPSIELSINRFDRVVGTHAYNSDGENILNSLDIKHKDYDTALKMIFELAEQKGFIQSDGSIYVTLQTDDKIKENDLLLKLTLSIDNHHYTANVFPVGSDIRDSSYKLNITPAKYLAILELKAVDPDASFEGCKGHTISEIKNMTQTHGHGNGAHGCREKHHGHK